MAIPVTENIGKARWTQGEQDQDNVEIRIPITLPDGVRPRNLTVEVKDGDVLCVSHQDTRLLQWRLYAPVNSEVEWRVEGNDEAVLVVDLEKKTAATWECLLNLPMRADDPLLTSMAEIDRLFRAQLPSLTPVAAATGGSEAAQEERKSTDATADDAASLDKLLEEAAVEVDGTAGAVTTKEAAEGEEAEAPTSASDIRTAFIKAELENYATEEREITKKLTELGEAEGEDEGAAATGADTASQQRAMLHEMMRLHDKMRLLRTEPSSLQNFIEYTKLDLQKARANVGRLGEKEQEEFANDEERAMSATELMTRGLQHFEMQDVKSCLHFLRLASVHYGHEQSIVLLYTLCSQLGSPLGALLLLERALDDKEPSALANFKVAELHDNGARHFLPLFPAALFFYERAARLGSVNAMLALAQLWQRGATSSSLLSDEESEALKNMPKFHAWLAKAIDRGSGSALFVKGCMYLNGEHGMPKSYADAKDCLDAATGAQPAIMRQAPLLPALLENLRKEQMGTATAAEAATTAKTVETPSIAAAAAAGMSVKDMAEEDHVTASAARLSALTGAAEGAGAVARRPASMSPAVAGATTVVRRTKKGFGGRTDHRVFWERSCVTGLVIYGIYTLLFPLRMLMLPTFYSLISGVVEKVPWLANRNADLGDFM